MDTLTRRAARTTIASAVVVLLLAACATTSPAPEEELVVDGDADDGPAPQTPVLDGPVVAEPVEIVPAPPVAGAIAAEQPEVIGGFAVRFTAAWEPAPSPQLLAERIARTEEQVRDASLPPEVRAAAAHEGQVAYRQLAREEAWRDEVIDALPERWRSITEANMVAADALSALHGGGDPPDSVPAWQIVPPAPASELLRHYGDAAADQGLDWAVLAAINLVETRMGRIRGFSSAGARGPMQFIPASWEAFGEGGDIDDERDAIFAAARHLRVRGGDPYDERTALFNYNNSQHYVDAVQAYANVLRADAGAYQAYHGWQVYYRAADQDLLMPVGYHEPERVPLEEYLARPVLEVVG